MAMARVLFATLFLTCVPDPARACVRSGEVNRLVGWSADGAYALFTLVDDRGAIEHAEIHPTRYAGSVYVVNPREEGGLVVTRVPIGTCPDFGDGDGHEHVVERSQAKLTEASLRALKTVAAMRFGREEEAAQPVTATARFTGKKRYEVHDLEITEGATTTVLPVPVWCVGSCLADENYTKWTANVSAVHRVAGAPLYEVRLRQVCNGGDLIRLIAPTPPEAKVPKRRCHGSGE